MADGVDVLMQAMKAARRHPPPDRVPMQTHLVELIAGDDTVLFGRNQGERRIRCGGFYVHTATKPPRTADSPLRPGL